jgi:hypothetical protein
MRQFEKIIHLGNGNDSLAECYKLHKRLDEGIMTLCGLQQTPVKKRDQAYLDDIIDDICTALGREPVPDEVQDDLD